MQERMTKLEHWLQDLLTLWGVDEATNVDGNILKNAYLNPKPIQKPHPPILIGGGGEKVTLKYVAKYAQMSNFGGSIETLQNKIKVLEKHCYDAGRNISDITTTTNMAAIIGLNEQEVKESVEAYRTKLTEFGHTVPSMDDFGKNRLIGTPEQILDQIDQRNDVGIKMINLTINDKRSEDLVGLLIKEY